ncbi:TetR/AcrR family transcriptional regulator [Hyphobacterium sp. CCMP332]|nr:TetR/AcrR family transcriptional regulator [Hyphobacterium sp. CCMP332]
MEVKLNLRDRIVECARGLFFKMGLRRVTMDDIAGKCGVSKKTIYQHFKDKDTVVLEVTKEYLHQEEHDLQKIHESAKDPIEELVSISKWFRDMLSNMDSSLLHDMKKYHPNSWTIFHQHKEKCIFCSLIENLKEGKKLGLYRSDLKEDIISRFRVESTEMMFKSDFNNLGQFHIRDLQLEIFEHFVYGIVTDKGREIFEKYKRELK